MRYQLGSTQNNKLLKNFIRFIDSKNWYIRIQILIIIKDISIGASMEQQNQVHNQMAEETQQKLIYQEYKMFSLYEKTLGTSKKEQKMWYIKNKKVPSGPYTASEMEAKLFQKQINNQTSIFYGKQNNNNSRKLKDWSSIIEQKCNSPNKVHVNKRKQKKIEQQKQVIQSEEKDEEQQIEFNQKDYKFFKTQCNGQMYINKEGQQNKLSKIKQINFSRVVKSYDKSLISMLQSCRGWWVVLPGYIFSQQELQQQYNPNQPKLRNLQLVLTGKIEKQQSPLQATIRQVKQQIGLDVKQEQIKGLYGGQLISILGSHSVKDFGRKNIFPSIVKLQKIQKPTQKQDSYKNNPTKQSIQTWVMIKDPNDPHFLLRKRSVKQSIGIFTGILKVQHLIQIFKQFSQRQRQIHKWKRRQRKKKNENIKKRFQEKWLEWDKIQDKNEQKQKTDSSYNIFSSDQKYSYRNMTQQQAQNYKKHLQIMYEEQIDDFIDYFEQVICPMTVDKFGKRVFRMLFRYSSTKQRMRIYKIIRPKLAQIVCHHKGGIVLQSVLRYISHSNQQNIMEAIFKDTLQNFKQIATTDYGYHFLNVMVQNFPFSYLEEISNQVNQNLQIFKELIANKSGVIFLRQFFDEINKQVIKYNKQSANIIKQKILKNLNEVLLEVIDSPCVFFVHRAYRILEPAQMKQITLKIIENIQQISMGQYSGQLCQDCLKSYWDNPQLEFCYEIMNQKISEDDIIKYFDQKKDFFLLKILKLNKELQVRDRIANVVFKFNWKQISQCKAWKFWTANKTKWYQNYQRIDNRWVIKPDANFDFQI